MSKRSVFVSYSWNDSYYVDRICDDLNLLGFEVVRDKYNIRLRQSISQFIKRIGSEDFVLLLISDNYLKSTACMKEILELGIENCKKDYVFPIVVKNTDVFNDKYLEYVKFWEDKVRKKNNELSKLDPCNNIQEYLKLKKEREISENIGLFITTIQDFLLCSPEDLWSKNYSQILNKIACVNIDYNDLFRLKKIKSKDLHDLLIKNARYLSEDIEWPIDLSRYDLKNKILVGKDIDLSGINFRYAVLSSACLIDANLIGCTFLGADLRGANLTYANLCDADLRGANLIGIKYKGIKIRNADFSYAIMDDKFKNFVLEHGK